MLRFLESFDHLSAAQMIYKWDTYTGAIAAGKGVFAVGTSGRYALQVPSDYLVVGFRFKVSSADASPILDFQGGAPLATRTRLETIRVGDDAKLRLSYGATEMQTYNTPLVLNQDYYIEVKITFATDFTGHFEARLDNNVIMSGTDVPTADGGTVISHLLWSRVGFGGSLSIDDVYVLDDAAGERTDFLGICKVACRMPTGAGDAAEWTPSVGNNWDCCDEAPASLVDYVSTYGSNNVDLYNLAAAGVTKEVMGVQAFALAADAGGAGSDVATALKSGSTEAYGTSRELYVAPECLTAIWEQDPDTSDDWTISAIDALQSGGVTL